MTFTGHEDHSVTLQEAAEWTKKYRDDAGSGAIIGGFFSKEAIEKLLNQTGAVGIRYYYGKEKDSTPILVLCAVDADENDLYEGELMELARPCPPNCSELNPLNS